MFPEPTPGSEDPVQLALQLKNGDPAALTGVIRALGPRVAAGLKKRHPSLTAEDIEDVLSIASHRLWQARFRYDAAKGSLRSWFFIIADNAAKDLLRKVKRQLERSMDLDLLPERESRKASQDSETEIGSWPAPGVLGELGEILLRLPAVDHRIITGYAQAEGAGPWAAALAVELGMRPGTIRVRCRRIKEKIRRELQAGGATP
jgi:RNA polymerase sigma factor (sigma-70 family)